VLLADVVAGFWTWILVPGYDNGPAVGPGDRGFHGSPGLSFLARRTGFLLVRRGAG
jgi:hypothetical protein